MAHRLIVRKRDFSNSTTAQNMTRQAAEELFELLKGTAGLDQVIVVNAQGHMTKSWTFVGGETKCEEPIGPRSANSVHNRRRG